MSNVIQFNLKAKKEVVVQGSQASQYPENDKTYMGMVDYDTAKLCAAAGITTEEAIQMASDFYRKYPMLIEHVRSAEYMLRNKK